MPIDRFFIGPFDTESGQTSDVRPFLIPDTAYQTLTNAYVFRGRTRKRFGSRWLGGSQLSSRFRVALSPSTDPMTGNFSGNIPAGVTGAIGQMFSIGTQVFTVYQANGNMYISGTATGATFNTGTGAVAITGAALNTTVYFYPSLPVMGLLTYEQGSQNFEPIIGFDTRYAYQYIAGSGWERLATGTATWAGNDHQFFWTTTVTGADPSVRLFLVTNFNENELMRSFDGTTWANFQPAIDSGPGVKLNSAKIILFYKLRVLAFNTWEGTGTPGSNYISRVRWSRVGNPLDADAWKDNQGGPGFSLDATTTEAIVGAGLFKDRIIVKMEQSTWELVYRNNQQQPFDWQQINSELGSESTFSTVEFDEFLLSIGDVGIDKCTGTNVARIDAKIPDQVFTILEANNGVDRVYGIRDYYSEMVYWTFPNVARNLNFPYPNQIFVYNYRNNTWAFFQDSITCFGYYQDQTGVTWDSTTVTWDDSVSWDDGDQQSNARQVIAGNQQGYTFIIDEDLPVNASVLQITDIQITNPGSNFITLTVINHNLIDGDYILLTNIVGTGNLNLLNFKIYFVITSLATPNTINIGYLDDMGSIIAGNYQGNGTIARVSNINILTKQYNFYGKEGRNCYVSKVDFRIDATDFGALTVEYYVSTNALPMVLASDPAGTDSLLGTNVLETSPYSTVPFEANAQILIHPVMFQADGEFIQLQITMSDEQMRTVIPNFDDMMNITSISGPALEDFQMHSMTFYATRSSDRNQ